MPPGVWGNPEGHLATISLTYNPMIGSSDGLRTRPFPISVRKRQRLAPPAGRTCASRKARYDWSVVL